MSVEVSKSAFGEKVSAHRSTLQGHYNKIDRRSPAHREAVRRNTTAQSNVALTTGAILGGVAPAILKYTGGKTAPVPEGVLGHVPRAPMSHRLRTASGLGRLLPGKVGRAVGSPAGVATVALVGGVPILLRNKREAKAAKKDLAQYQRPRKSLLERAKRVSKAKDRKASGAAIAGTGGVTTAVGLAGGGIPRVKATRLLADVKTAHGPHRKVAEAARAYRGGEFAYRTNAHQTYKTFNLGGKREGESHAAHFKYGQTAGARGAEDKIIGHLKLARRASNVAMAGGAGLTAYGVYRAKHPKKTVVKAQKKNHDVAYGAMAGGGATATGALYGGARAAEHQGRKWSARAARDIDLAGKIVPGAGGHVVNPHPDKVKNKRVPDIGPKVTSAKIAHDPSILAGHSRGQAHAVGMLRGAAAKHRYFAGTYGSAARYARFAAVPAAATAVVGAGGLALSRRKKVKKDWFEASD